MDAAVAEIAAAIGEAARARMLYTLMDGHARTSTELAVVAGVSPSTASVHLQRLREQHLIRMAVQGKHRYYTLEGPHVAAVLEALSVVAGRPRTEFRPTTPTGLRAARTCYDHLAGALGVALNDRFQALGWLSAAEGGSDYEVTPAGDRAFAGLGMDIAAARGLRRRFAGACLDWSERRPHLGGALGAELLRIALERKWVTRELDSRALAVTRLGRGEFEKRVGVRV